MNLRDLEPPDFKYEAFNSQRLDLFDIFQGSEEIPYTNQIECAWDHRKIMNHILIYMNDRHAYLDNLDKNCCRRFESKDNLKML